MPWLQVNVLSGRDDRVLAKLIAELSKTTAEVLEVPVGKVRVLINEVPPARWGVGGIRIDQQDGEGEGVGESVRLEENAS